MSHGVSLPLDPQGPPVGEAPPVNEERLDRPGVPRRRRRVVRPREGVVRTQPAEHAVRPHPSLPGTITRKLDKDEINGLPVRRWEGPVHLVRDTVGAADAVAALGRCPVLGFDTETKPVFRKGVVNRPALVQLASDSAVYLFQLPLLSGNYVPLVRLLEDVEVRKVGVGLDQDVAQLRELFPFEPRGFVDVGRVAQEVGMESRGLRSLAACLFGFRVSKRAQCSNWEKDDLQPYQIQYAATDAWVSREIYLKLLGVLGESFLAPA
ncbi:MAG: 3'-5' exonuclease domain-containing protein 2 [Magnetococcus sp. WYHC-3]